jgi:iron complex outermembrane recepter protein
MNIGSMTSLRALAITLGMIGGAARAQSVTGTSDGTAPPRSGLVHSRDAGNADAMVNSFSPAGSSAASGNSEIVVTAGKREELVQRVPGAITALTGVSLDRQNVAELKDYVALVPGLSTSAGAQPGFGQIVIRGITTGHNQASPTVGFYVDDVPITANGPIAQGASIAFDPDLGDIARIEVLKGPQSTLYGAGSLGGLIKIVTNEPDFSHVSGDVRMGVQDTDGGDVGGGARATINVPITNNLAIRAVGYYRHDGGFTDNDISGKKNVDDSDSYGGRVTLLYKPTDRFDIKLMGIIQNIDSKDAAYVMVDANGKPIGSRYGQSTYTAEPSDVRYRLIDANINYDFGFAKLTSTSSYAYENANQTYDYSTSYGGYFNLFPEYRVPAEFPFITKKFSQEVRLASPNSHHLEWMIGGFYTHESDQANTDITVVDPTTGAQEPLPLGNFYTTNFFSKYREYAVFANATYYIAPSLDVAGGIRYSHNDQDYINLRTGTFCGSCITRSGSSSDSAKTYQFTVRWRPAKGINLYAKAASAYRPGGPVIALPGAGGPTSYQADHLWNYEVGAKTSFANGHVLLDVSGYHIDWTDIQLNGQVGGLTVIQNGGKATSDGAEASITVIPTQGLTFGANFSYDKAKLKSVPAGVTLVTHARAGDTLPYTPKITMAVTADYDFPLTDKVRGLLGATGTFQDSKEASFSADPLNMKIPSYAALNLRAGIEFDRYEVLLHIDNVTNSFGIISSANWEITASQRLPFMASVIRPRTFGATVSAKF